jgi:Trypsin-like peptidase domain
MPRRRPNPGCVIKVGHGRGFIIEHRVKVPRPKRPPKGISLLPFVDRRLVVTAAHCLPKFPPATAASHWDERTYEGLLGSLDGDKKAVWAECLFANPIADVAVLGCPDSQELPDETDAYSALTDGAPILQVGNARSGSGWVLSLDGRWVRTTIEVFSSWGGGSLSIDPTEAGMSGSPILNDAGLAVGIVALGTETVSDDGKRTCERAEGQPILVRHLPGWLL